MLEENMPPLELKEKAQKSDTSEAKRAWLEKGHHMELVPAVPGQKLSLQSGPERQLSQGMGTNGKGPEKTLHVLLVRKALSETGSACRDTTGEEEPYINFLGFYSIYPVTYLKC